MMNLGYFYYKGYDVSYDIDKAIHYFSLAANQIIQMHNLLFDAFISKEMELRVILRGQFIIIFLLLIIKKHNLFLDMFFTVVLKFCLI